MVGQRKKMRQAGAAADLIAFWRQAGRRGLWFAKSVVFDRAFRDRFLNLHLATAARRHDDWMESPSDALGLLILTDQFPRNAFRGTAHMYATDPLARYYAHHALEAGYMEQVELELRFFFCLPFAHSENLCDQDLSVRLHATLGQPWLEHAEEHRDIIRRFGRFPHRNAMFGRQNTPEESEFLLNGGFGG